MRTRQLPGFDPGQILSRLDESSKCRCFLAFNSHWLSCVPVTFAFALRAYKRLIEKWICYILRTLARKSSTTQFFFILLLQSDKKLPMSEMQKNSGVTDFVFEIKHVEKYPNFDKLVLVTRHGLDAQKQLVRTSLSWLALQKCCWRLISSKHLFWSLLIAV